MNKWQSRSSEGGVKIVQKNIVDKLRVTIELDDIFVRFCSTSMNCIISADRDEKLVNTELELVKEDDGN